MSNDTPTKKERRDAARAARVERERAEAAASARRRRLMQLGGVLAAAIVVVAIAIAVSAGGGSGGDSGTVAKKPGEAVAGQRASRSMLAGIPQSGLTLGDPKAKVTLVEFADPQCPFCREYALNVMPRLIRDYVRTGKVKMEFRALSFIGPDSERAARIALAAADQDRLWNYIDLVYYNQGEENSGYATDDWLRRIGGAVPGLDVGRAFAARQSGAVTGRLGAANGLAQRYAVNSTPSFLVGRGTQLHKIDAPSASLDALRKAIDAELAA
jgi:protein-disulfide isomerase